jgi:CRISPR-associated protein Csy2
MTKIILLKNLKIHNANALSSPYTIGFPAVTGWLGAVHAMQRHLNEYEEYKNLKFESTGIICHNMNLQTYKGITDKGYKQKFSNIISTANPLTKTGNRPSIIPDARCHLTVSLVIKCSNSDGFSGDDAKQRFKDIVQRTKFAGGDLISTNHIIDHEYISGDDSEQDLQRLRNKIKGGWWLIERRDLMKKAMEDGQDALDALLDYLKIHHKCVKENEKVTWVDTKKELGWLVPIATGFQALTTLGKLEHQRDLNYQHCFAEAIVTLGQFKMFFSDDNFWQMLWKATYDKERNQYLCIQTE